MEFQKINTREGLPSKKVNQIYKDLSGFIWILTDNGLCRYDGYDLKIYRYNQNDTNSITNSQVTIMAEDSTGRLWLGCAGDTSGILYYNREKDNFTRLMAGRDNKNGLLPGQLIKFYQARNGSFWLGTSYGLLQLNYNTLKFKLFTYSGMNGNESNVGAIVEDNAGNFICGTWRDGILKFDVLTHKFSSVASPPELTGSLYPNFLKSKNEVWVWPSTGDIGAIGVLDVNSLQYSKLIMADDHFPPNINSYVEDKNALNYYSTSSGLYVGDLESGNYKVFKNDILNPSSLSTDRPGGLFIDDQDIMWIGSEDGGVNIYDPNRIKFRESVPSINYQPIKDLRSIKSILKTKDGNYWIGTDYGVSVLNGKKEIIKNFRFEGNKNISLIPGGITRIFEDSKGIIWFGSWGGGLQSFNRETNDFTYFEPGEPFSGEFGRNKVLQANVYDIEEDSSGLIWLSFLYQGIDAYDRNTNSFEHYIIEGILDGTL
ncbi:MAG: hypothetical protein HC906_17195 [Bacteroidales bacterium]|nr:hypothetical protein [Bacteroidales bacterium]